MGKGPFAVPTTSTVLRIVVRIAESGWSRPPSCRWKKPVEAADFPTIMLLDREPWVDSASEDAALGSTEISSLINGTGDSRPIHIRMVRFQVVLDRGNSYVNELRAQAPDLKFTGPWVPSNPNEDGIQGYSDAPIRGWSRALSQASKELPLLGLALPSPGGGR